MKNGLYHSDVFIPNLKVSSKNIRISYTQHALFASKSDRYEDICLPEFVNLSEGKIIELEVRENKAFKILVRLPYDKNCDLCIVLLVKELKAKTVWLNRKSDCHKTLDRGRYIQG